MKRILILLLIVVGSVLSGCSSETDVSAWKKQAPELGLTEDELVDLVTRAQESGHLTIVKIERTASGGITIYLRAPPPVLEVAIVYFHKETGRWLPGQ